jgi:hypothetical protein
MNKTSLSPSHLPIRTIFIFALCALIGLIPFQMAQADAAPPPDPTVGGVGPYQPQKTNVQMMSERVVIDVATQPGFEEPKQIRVDAGFTMRNQGQTEEQMQVIFPLTRLNYEPSQESFYSVDITSFAVKVDGRLVSTTEITTPPEISANDMEHGFAPEVQWAAFDVTFPVDQDVLLQVEYNMLNEYAMYGGQNFGFTGIAYILETGAGWFGNILSADIILRLPYPATQEVIQEANPGYVISGNEMHWKLRDFEPTREDNLTVSVIRSDVWQDILDLRSTAGQRPDDADVWAGLGDKYMELGIYTKGDYIIEINGHFTDLAVEARQKAVNLRPEWGDAHYKLAEILWLSNPSVKNRFRTGGESTSPDPRLDDPAIQKVLYELQLAWSLGATGDLSTINQVFPELKLTPPAIAAATNARPTDSPTLMPPVSPTSVPAKTPSPTRYEVLISASVGLVIVIGVLVYLWRSKRAA